MTSNDYDEFKRLLNDLAVIFPKRELENPAKCDAFLQGYWRALKDVPLPTFRRFCERWEKQGTKFPAPANLRPAPEQSPEPENPGKLPVTPHRPTWEEAAISLVGRHICGHFARYSHPADLPLQIGGTLTPEALRNPDYRPHPVSQELREPIREAGRQWAAEMREQVNSGRKPCEQDRRDAWQVFLPGAEAEVDAIRARHGLPAPAPANTRVMANPSSSAAPIRPRHDEAQLRQSVHSLMGQKFPVGDIAKALSVSVADVERLSTAEAA